MEASQNKALSAELENYNEMFVPNLSCYQQMAYKCQINGTCMIEETGVVLRRFFFPLLQSPPPSHLRTMTALLDPAQIEERERKRVKQLEHQV